MKIVSIKLADEPRMPRFDDKGQEWVVTYIFKGNTKWVKNLYAIDEMDAYIKVTESIKHHKT
jgi:hypothetical protein